MITIYYTTDINHETDGNGDVFINDTTVNISTYTIQNNRPVELMGIECDITENREKAITNAFAEAGLFPTEALELVWL